MRGLLLIRNRFAAFISVGERISIAHQRTGGGPGYNCKKARAVCGLLLIRNRFAAFISAGERISIAHQRTGGEPGYNYKEARASARASSDTVRLLRLVLDVLVN